MPPKRSGTVSRPIVIMIAIFATLLAAGLFLGIPYLQGRPAFPRGTFPLLVEGNQIMVEMDPNGEVFLLGDAPLVDAGAGTGGPVVGQLVTSTPAIIATTAPPTPVTPVIVPTAAPPTATPQPQASCVIFTSHTVQAGETLFSISRQYVTSIPLMARHGISSTSLTPGAVISVPVGNPACCTNGWRPYVVESGDTWFGIAQQCGITVDSLLGGNGLSAGATLYMTSVICIP
ncbi:MAG TPA: LysM peptidoglycan-binding domain-containing protein [Promineifilum sp.]|nr:LysM peptidoglycan-binding domain-containing protein [Promineifilum sp.]HQF70042.1 LysM peptidoglycan-binding domain-containing protein [Promineifilum sp.]